MNQDKLVEVIEKVVAENELLLVDIVLRGNDNNRIIEIFIDSKDVLTTEVCAKVSRELGEIIDEEELITSKYRLDVSSPGIDRPLKFIEQYHKNIERKFSVRTNDNKEFEGKLQSIEDEVLTFNVKGKERKLNFNEIKTAKVLISF